jgi:glucoamylase
MRLRAALSVAFAVVALAVVAFAVVAAAGATAGHAAAPTPPKPNWLPADKQGFGTSRTLASKVWFTLEGGSLSEVYYPRLDTPSFRDLQYVRGCP